jgi:formylglycine-generating enzyme required for sulfatase activity
MKNSEIAILLLGLATAAQASSPAISGVNVRQDASRLVTIGYTVDQDCIVTVDVLTNGVSIGESNFTNMTGDVNKKVSSGTRTICWQPMKSWPDHRIAAGGMTVEVKAWPLCAPPPYMVVDLYQDGDGYLGDGEFVHYFASTNAFPGGFGARVYKTTTIVMRHIPAAGVRWRMGMSAADVAALGPSLTGLELVDSVTYGMSETAHYVTLTNDYWISIYELTQAQAKRFSPGGTSYLTTNSSDGSADFDWTAFDRDVYPLCNWDYNSIRGSTTDGIDWPTTGDTVGGFLQRFRSRTDGMKFDLPTDAQWEFACRAGEGAQLYDGSSVFVGGTGSAVANVNEIIAHIAWFKYYYDANGTLVTMTHPEPVGLRKPNAWGLYDMVGNVYEWCLDWYDATTSADAIDPRGPATAAHGSRRVVRGGGWNNHQPLRSRSSFRDSLQAHWKDKNFGGCRLVITIP